MDLFLLHRDELHRYYNCSVLTDDQWKAEGAPSISVGLFNFISGVFFIALTIPCLIVMLRPELRKFSCYKIMFYIGIIDVICLSANALLTGVLAMVGAMPCPHIELMYPIGCFGVDIWKPKLLTRSFQGKRTYYWIGLCVVYAVYAIIFSRSAFFTSKNYAWYYSPYTGVDGLKDIDESYYINKTQFVNNIIVVTVLPALYAFLSFSIWWNSRGHTSSHVNRVQIQVAIQSFFLCFLDFAAATLYVYMQFFSTPMQVTVFAQFVWQFANGRAFIYIIMNKTIRREVCKMMPFNVVAKRIGIYEQTPRTSNTNPQSNRHNVTF
ncbi:hypothetical protein QR680_015958 [Steinernema hermaphroditum]|uniref:Uncharacterized protein n=1 Tax=Steinernema hermaphroditum TaxID=289476 RepID=A0AA39LLM8_9BILA|nr:hypothetical protein QR680_015958 [Steinernema hermaphroditum]